MTLEKTIQNDRADNTNYDVDVYYDKFKRFPLLTRYSFLFLSLGLALIVIYTSTVGLLPSMQQRSIILALGFGMVFLAYPTKGQEYNPQWYDWLLSVVAFSSSFYVTLNASYFAERFYYLTPLSPIEMFFGVAGIILLLEAARRTTGYLLFSVIVIFLAYALWGQHLPGQLSHQGFTVMWIVDHIFYTPSGVFGVPLSVAATYVGIFVFFGTMLSFVGGGEFFTKLAMGALGTFRGGPAKVAIFSSGLIGMIMGASSANVVTTGSVTIPLMRRVGYKKEFASAVEAAASTGGEVAPPIMGAAAFILAHMVGTPYANVAKAAIIPALMFFLAIYIAVDLESLKLKLYGMTKDKLPDVKQVLKDGFLFILPIIIVLYTIFAGYTPIRAGAYAFIATLIISIIKKSKRLTLREYIDGLITASYNLTPVVICCAVAGILVGVITLTGLGMYFTGLVTTLSGGNLFIALFIAMIIAIILGMGMPPSAAYIIEAVIVAPALVDLGITPLAAHLFIFYFACFSAVTPPIAVSSFAAAALSGSNPMKVGWIAARLALPGLLIPYIFVYVPELLLQTEFHLITLSNIALSILGIVALAITLENYFKSKLVWYSRLLFLIASILLIFPMLQISIIGFALFALLIYLEYFQELSLKASNKDNVSV